MKKAILSAIITLFSFFAKSQELQFIENKGQWHSLAKYKTDINTGSLFLEADGYRIVLNNLSDFKKIAEGLSGHSKSLLKNNSSYILHSHAYEVKFGDANTSPQIMPADPIASYNNYFIGKDPSKWASHCKIFKSIIYKNIYQGVDVRYYTENGHFKYDFTIHPGTDIKKIKLLFKGVDKLALDNQNLIIKTSVGELSELKPYTYQIINNSKSVINTAFTLSGNTVSFIAGNYDKTKDIIIDPTLIFSSFVGSIADDWGYCSAYDSKGNFFAGSAAFANGFPVSLGAFQSVFHGGDGSEGFGLADDIAIFKFNADGTQRLYATYLGGSGDEQPQSMIADKSDNLIISGRTSSSDFPVTQTNFGGGGNFDIYISKLNADGTALLASRKIGGAKADGVNIYPKYVATGIASTRRNYNDDSRSDIITDDNDNIYLAGCTQSSDFPTTANAFKKNLSGMQDGIFIKASADLSGIYNSSYIGGNNNDAVFSIARNKLTGTIYLAGSTSSTDIAISAADNVQGIIHKNFSGGDCDGFVSMIRNDANALLRTVYIGTSGNDMVYEICTDNSGYPYITGTTTVSFPVINAAWSQVQSKQFITKLDTDILQIKYSTNFGKGGSAPDISPVAFATDKCENVYVVGWGGNANEEYYPGTSVTGLSTTPDALNSSTDGNDFYIFALGANASHQVYGSFFGTQDPNAFGDHVDGAACRFDNNGNLYLAACANCAKKGVFPTTTGVWSPDNKAATGALCNFAGVKINFNFSNCTLATTLLKFNAVYQNQSAFLSWQTASEVNTEKFMIQQSNDAFNYSDIANVQARGSNAQTTSYGYTQARISAGIHYYRLKIFDKDGSYTYSNIVSILADNDGKPYIFISPNPSHSLTTVYFTKVGINSIINVLNSKGQLVKQKNVAAGEDQLSLNVESLPAGVYYFVLITSNNRFKAVFIKK